MIARPTIRLLTAVAVALAAATAAAYEWKPLDKDGLHDPDGPGIELLQEPANALVNLPPDTAGNNVKWIPALREGVIQPRERLRPSTEIRRYDKDVLLNLYGSMPAVRFPHRTHTEWLDCSNCHDHLFKAERGANQISMFLILQGQQCGVCHGAVAFPLTECRRCHSVPNDQAQREAAAMEAAERAQAKPEAAPTQPAEPSPAPTGEKPSVSAHPSATVTVTGGSQK